MKLQVYRNLDELAGLHAAWDELLVEYPLSSTFSTWEWLTCWWHSFGPGRELLVLALFDESSRLLGLAPFSISAERFGGFLPLRVVRLMGDGSGDSDNLDFPVRPGFNQLFSATVLEYLQQQKRQWDLCELNTLPADSPAASSVTAWAGPRRWTCIEYFSPSSAIALPDTWEKYVETISSEDRKNLVRYTERLKRRYSTRIYRCTKEEDLPIGLDALFRLHQGRWKSAGEPGTFSSPERREFYKELSRCLLNRGWLELWILELNGDVAAVQFAFRYRDTVFQLQEGYDHSRPADRAGYVLRGEVLKQLISEKVRRYDFLGGEDTYKSRWAAQTGRYRKICLARPLTLAGLLLRLVDRIQRSKSWLRTKLPSSAWRVLHRVNISIRRKPEIRDVRIGSAKQAGDS
jgi:CelD/BcsL family acetyltransferase involved in cellulose biosynthesis